MTLPGDPPPNPPDSPDQPDQPRSPPVPPAHASLDDPGAAGADPAAKAPAMDPRIEQRRVEVRQAEAQRRLRLLVSAAGVVALGLTAWGVLRSPEFAVRRVRVFGEQHTAPLQIAYAAGLTRHRQMIDLAPAAMARAVEALPWVDHAVVVRHWPKTVVLTVTERRAVAAVPERTGGWAVVDASGRVLAVDVGLPPGVPAVGLLVTPPAIPPPVVARPGGTVPSEFDAGLTVAAALGTLSARVQGIAIAADGQVQLNLSGGATALIGPTDGLTDKLTAVATMLSHVKVGRATLDVRVPSAPVLTGP